MFLEDLLHVCLELVPVQVTLLGDQTCLGKVLGRIDYGKLLITVMNPCDDELSDLQLHQLNLCKHGLSLALVAEAHCCHVFFGDVATVRLGLQLDDAVKLMDSLGVLMHRFNFQVDLGLVLLSCSLLVVIEIELARQWHDLADILHRYDLQDVHERIDVVLFDQVQVLDLDLFLFDELFHRNCELFQRLVSFFDSPLDDCICYDRGLSHDMNRLFALHQAIRVKQWCMDVLVVQRRLPLEYLYS